MTSSDHRPPPFAIFVGSGRSGTTLFRNVFDSHPDLAITHEAHFIAPLLRRRRRYETSGGVDLVRFVDDLYENPNFRRQGLDRDALTAVLRDAAPDDVASAVRAVFAHHADVKGKSRYGDKTPGYVAHLDLLAAQLPEARFVHIVRDGRDVALAYLDRSEWGPETLAECAFYWKSRVGRGRRAGRRIGPARYREVRYEDLVDRPEQVTAELCDFLGLEYRPEMLSYHEQGLQFIASAATPEAFSGLSKPITKGMRDWRNQMSPDDVAMFEAIAGDVLADAGYERATDHIDTATRRAALMARVGWERKRIASRLGR